jgi:hypothetical protein
MRTSDETTLLFTALHIVQAELPTIPTNQKNDYYDSLYADLTAVCNGVRELLKDNGLSVVQGVHDPHYQGGHASLCTRLCHVSGQWIEDDGVPLLVSPDKKGNATAQQQGSAMSYARRQGISAMLCIVTNEDDDAAAASATLPSRTKPKAGEKSKPKTKKLTGPIKTMTALKEKSAALATDVDACTELDQLAGVQISKENKPLIAQLKKDWPEAHEKLVGKISDKERQLTP